MSCCCLYLILLESKYVPVLPAANKLSGSALRLPARRAAFLASSSACCARISLSSGSGSASSGVGAGTAGGVGTVGGSGVVGGGQGSRLA